MDFSLRHKKTRFYAGFKRKNGSLTHCLPELSQAHKKIQLFSADKAGISQTFAELYTLGLSLTDISRQTGKAKSSIRDALKRAGISLRDNVSLPVSNAAKESGKRNIRPYYGFCYFQGRIVPDPREFETLTYIHQLWKKGTNPNRLTDLLNEKKVLARSAKHWNRNSVVNIITRFQDQQIILTSGGKYELR